MKVTAASAALALLPAGVMSELLEKRGLECNTVYGQGQAKVAGKVRLATQTKIVGGRTVERTVKTKHTVFVTPTVSRTLTGTITSTSSVTTTVTGKPTTITTTGSSTSTVPPQPGFTAASAAVPSKNTNAKKGSSNGKAAAAAAAAAKSKKHTVTTVMSKTHTVAPVTSKAHHVSTIKGKKHAGASAAHKKHHTKREADAEPARDQKAAARVPLSVVCTRTADPKTITQTVAQKPYATKYGKAQTVVINRQKTKHVEKVVATSTIHRQQIVEAPRATHWAACQSDNLLGWTWGWGSGSGSVGLNATIGGGNGTSSATVGISSVILTSGTNAQSFDTSTATQCCIKCQTTPGCVGSQWRSGVCNIHVRPAQFGACSANQQVFTLGSFFANPLAFLEAEEGYILSNGRCGGTWKFGGLTL